MPNQVVPINGLDQAGVVQDIPPTALPPNAFSDARNVRFRDGAVRKMEGEVNILPYINFNNDELRYVAWWPNPNLSVFNSGYYLIILQQLDSMGNAVDNAYIVDARNLGTIDSQITLTDTSDNFKGTFEASGTWQHTFFQGGFSLIINNGLEAPHFILDNEDNTNIADVPNFLELPGWDSYAVVTDDSTDPPTTRTVATVTAGVIRSFGSFLVAGNLVERAAPVGGAAPEIIRSLPGVIRSSDIAAPGEIPMNWNPFATGASTADEFTITSDGVVQDLVELQGNLYIYSNSSISAMTTTGNTAAPLAVRPVTNSYGTLTTNGVLEFDGRHLIVGSQDIYLFGGHPGSIQSVADTKVRREFFNRLNPLSIDQTFMLRYQQRDEIWICYATVDATSDRINEALVWNYRNNTFTYRDLQNVTAGTIGPVPGGGLPFAEITLAGDNSGDNSVVTAGNAHVNRLTHTGRDIQVQNLVGRRHEHDLLLSSDFPIQRDFVANPVWTVELGSMIDTGTMDGLRLVIETRQYRYIATPQSNAPFSRIEVDGNMVDYNFLIELPAGINNSAGHTGNDFRVNVLYPIFRALAANPLFDWSRAGDPDNPPELASITRNMGAPMQLHLTSRDDTFAIEFDQFVDGGATEVYIGERTIIPTGGLTANTSRNITATTVGSARTRDLQGVSGATQDFLITNTTLGSDVLYFFNNLPSGAVVFEGVAVPPAGSFGPTQDGEQRDETSGDAMNGGLRTAENPVEDGDRRVAVVYNTIVREPIRNLPVGEIRYQVWIPGTIAVTSFGLNAFNLPGSLLDGNPGGSSTTEDLEDINFDIDDVVGLDNPPAVLNFNISFSTCVQSVTGDRYEVETDRDLVRSVNVQAILAARPQPQSSIDAGESLGFYQRRIFANTIGEAFNQTLASYMDANTTVAGANENGVLVPTGAMRDSEDFTIALRSSLSASVIITLGGVDNNNPMSGQPAINPGTHVQVATTPRVQGFFPYVNREVTRAEMTNGPAPIRRFRSPSIRISHTTTGGRNFAFGFTSTVLDLVPSTYTGTTAYTKRQQLTRVAEHIIAAQTPVQWSMGTVSTATDPVVDITSIDFTIPAGTKAPHLDGMMVPSERALSNFTIDNLHDVCGEPFITTAQPTFTSIGITSAIQTQGVDEVRNTPTYAAMLLSNSSIAEGPQGQPAGQEVLLLSYGTGAQMSSDAETVSLGFINDITRFAPRLTSEDSGVGSFTLNPANFSDLANFVQEFVINDTSGITRLRELLDETRYAQHVSNVRPYGTIADRLDANPTQSNYLQTATYSTGLQATLVNNSPAAVIEFDGDRPWPRNQVNFTQEYPIFASTVLHASGNNTSKILGADIGWSKPAYIDGGTRVETRNPLSTSSIVITGQDAPLPYTSYVERKELAMVPEFTTELLASVSCWIDGSTEIYFNGPLSYNILELQVGTADAPGNVFTASSDDNVKNALFISDDYKADIRVTGRFLNYRITDETTAVSPNTAKTFSQQSEWRLSGLQLDIGKAGTR